MNIALIRPPKISGAFEKILIQEPVNIAYLAAFLKAKGYQVCIWDFEVEPFTESAVREKISRFSADVAAITAMTPTINNAHETALMLKKIKPSIVIVAGGAHVSALPEETLRDFPAFDYVVAGEGEIPLAELCRKVAKKQAPSEVPCVAWRNNGTITLNKPGLPIEDLDSIPFPQRSLFNPLLYKNAYAAGISMYGKRSTVVFTSRGCAQDCTFCAVKKTSGPRVRFRSAENVIKELTECRDIFGYNHITFEDTNLTLNRERFLNICAGLRKLKLTWDCQTKVSLVDKELIDIMKAGGCLKIAYGVESGSPKMLALMKKNITPEQIRRAFQLTHQAGIVACGFFILGTHPEETNDDVRQTEALIHEIKPDVFQLGIICPYPGTEIYSIMKKEGLLPQADWKKFNFMHSRPQWGTKHLSPAALVSWQKKIYMRYILTPHFILFVFRKMLNPREIPQTIRLGLSLLKYLLLEKRG
ncbi:MAG: B12-binding domain-containing radical SAM protein [Candidatus Omnitrophica bacterium]|nr:B12-binding domain-containing radical SAM protein [Candidatus Omnitrophota bacterium]MBU4478253.1 B12-binding domain-containing radical SAM protein [Candidatus Omnitrophota bacterium]MCG2703321.1 B12-binding domain-containing radical SAM protein [Candidatus Omnitrophota bacterium]